MLFTAMFHFPEKRSKSNALYEKIYAANKSESLQPSASIIF